MKNVKSETALKFGVGICRNNSEKKVYECGGKKLSELDLSYKKIAVFIGSEGGFEKEEVDYALSKGATAVHLGERILRCETAPVAALAVLMNLTGNL